MVPLAELREIVGDRHVLTEPDDIAGSVVDWTGRFVGFAPAVVRPGSVEEVVAVVDVCRRMGIALVPQGGNTGLVGGGVPLAGEVVLSLTRLTSIDVDADAGQVEVGAGASIGAVHAAAAAAGWAYGVDFASRDSATVGGSIATNAGGVHVLRYGMTRQQVVGVEAVLGSGQVIRELRGLEKDNTGYALSGLLCGSEGTLGVVTRARLRLVTRHERRVTALFGVATPGQAVQVAARLRREVADLEALEFVMADTVELVRQHLGRSLPLEIHPGVVIVAESAASDHDPAPALAAVLDDPAVLGVAVAEDPTRRAELWSWRERVTEVINTVGAPHKFDVTVPMATLGRFVESVALEVQQRHPGSRCWLFGHLGDGNVHVNVTGSVPDGDALADLVLHHTVEHGGTISAEHGIGTAKRRWLHLVRSRDEIEVMRAIKRALDPDHVLNPNVLLP